MADNIKVDNADLTDYDVSADEVPGPPVRHIQRVKLAYSADGDETHIGADVNGLDVDVVRSALPTGAATETTLAGIKTGTDKIPTSPAQEHATAASPHAARLSDGAAFYDSAKTGQLPAALGANGGLKIEGVASGTPVPISGNVGVVGAVEVVNDVGNPLPVSATSLPLPTGAATEATLATRATEATLAALAGDLGDTADAETANTLVGLLKRLVSRLVGNLSGPATWQAVPTVAGDLIVGTCTVIGMHFVNTTAAQLSVTVKDRAGTPLTVLDFDIPARSVLDLAWKGAQFTSGINWVASGAGMRGAVVAYQ